jgi:putative ABC transport system substrate-binding protein
MKRREFIVVLGGSALWPLAALGQQTATRVVGVLGVGQASGCPLEALRTALAPVRRGLAEMGYVEGQNLAIEFRCADGHEERLKELAADLVQRRVDVFYAPTGAATVAAKATTTSIPIVFATAFDPVASGFVASLNRPGGNVTGISLLGVDTTTKRLQVLCELVPTAKTIGILHSRQNVAGYDRILKDVQSAADSLSVKLLFVDVRRPDDFEQAFAKVASTSGALFISGDILMLNNREALVDLAARHRIPASYPNVQFVAAGGLVSLGTNFPEAFRQAGDYLGRVLNGEKPENLPVMQVTKVDLVINMKTAKALGLTIPPTLLARADEVIE